VDGETIETTPEHPFYTADGEWVAAANLAQVTDPRGVTTTPNGVTTRVEHNAFGLPERVIADDGTGGGDLNATTDLDYDSALNLRRMTDANGNETWYAFTARNLVAAEHYADDTAMGYTYDGRGNVGVQTLQDGQAITHTYDALGRVTGKALAASGWQTYTYDAEGRLLTAEETLNGHTTRLAYAYNAPGDLVSTAQTVDGTSWTVLYAYDYSGGVYTVTYPSGVQRVYELDPLGRLDAVREGDGPAVADYAYYDVDGYTAITYANGLTARIDYDTLGPFCDTGQLYGSRVRVWLRARSLPGA
jgi:YD repeat-containing protein